MPTVQDVLLRKGNQIHTIAPHASVLDAVNRMNEFKIGALVVMDGGGRVAGIFTERDVLRRVLAQGRDVSAVKVAEVMTREVICCQRETDLDEISSIMTLKRVRHVPVCGPDGEVEGIVSIGDVNAFHASHQEATIHFLSEYIYGRA